MDRKNKKDYWSALPFESNRLPLLGRSLIVGLFAGVVVSCFRLAIVLAEDTSFSVYEFVSGKPLLIVLLFVTLVATGYGIGRLIKALPMSNSSGIPQVKGLITGHFDYSWWKILIAKFIGSNITTLGGLAFGREGPAIQLGGCVGQGVGKKFARTPSEKKMLIASGAAAGLGVALNAPIAGVMFAIEEIFKYFSPLILLCTMSAALAAQFVASNIFGIEPIFHFDVVNNIPFSDLWLLIPMGIILGFGGVIYNYSLLKSQRVYKRIRRLPAVWRPVVPFLLAGVLGLIFPEVLCSGDIIMKNLDVSLSMKFLLLLLAVKFVFFVVCFGSGAPGGNLYPILVLGAIFGAIFGVFAVNQLGFAPELFANIVILAMAGYFSAIARTPITGIILLLEVTGSFQQLMPLAVVSLVAFVVADLLKSQPIYEALLDARVAEENPDPQLIEDKKQKTTVEMIVHHGSFADGKLIKKLPLPGNCLIIGIKRGECCIIPHGDTRILPGDYLVVVTDQSGMAEAYVELTQMTSCK